MISQVMKREVNEDTPLQMDRELTELAHLPRIELNTSITNLYKALANLLTVAYRVRLNATKINLLHAIGIYFLDRIKCNAQLNMSDLTVLVNDNIQKIRTYYNKSQKPNNAEGLSSVTILKLKSVTWSEFRSAIIETLSRVKGCNNIPLSYVTRDDVNGYFEESHESREER